MSSDWRYRARERVGPRVADRMRELLDQEEHERGRESMMHAFDAERLRQMLDQEGWFSLVRRHAHSTVLHLRTTAGSEPVCVLVTDGSVISVLVGKPTADAEIVTFRDHESVVEHLRDIADWTETPSRETPQAHPLFRRKGTPLPDDATLPLGHELDNGARILHHTPSVDGRAGFAFAILEGEFWLWRVSNGPDGRLQNPEQGVGFYDDFDSGWTVYRDYAGIS